MVPLVIVLYKGVRFEIYLSCIYIIPSAVILYQCSVLNPLTTVYMVPLVIVFYKGVIAVKLTALYIPPFVIILNKSCRIKVYST